MKRKYIILILVLFLTYLYTEYEKSTYHKVLKINSPTSINIDLNKNLIFDENLPYNIENLSFIDKNKDYSNDKYLNELTSTEKLFANYYANYHSQILLKGRFVQLKNNKIYIRNKEYKQLLLDTGFFFENNDKSKEKFIKNIKKYNLNDYVILNTRSKRYHNLSCQNGQKSKNYKIIKKEYLSNNILPCKDCILNNEIKQTIKIDNNITNIDKTFKNQNIQLFFLDLNEIYKPTSNCNTLACKALKEEIRNTKHNIDFAIYGINNQDEIFNELINAQKRGVKIRWVTDFDKKKQNHYSDTLKLQKILTDYNTDKIYDLNNRSAIMHNKFFIFDDKKVFTGSSNISGTGLTGFNANISVLIENKDIALIYKNEFEQMYNGNFHTKKQKTKNNLVKINTSTKIKTVFSPQDKIISTQIIPLINKAEKYIYIPIFFITKKELITPLINAKNRGVDIKIINDATNASSKYSIHKILRNNNIDIKTENFAGKLHTKSMIIDDKISIIGSMNFSNNGELRNDENVLIIYNEDISTYLRNIFLYLWNKIPNKYLNIDQKAESIESIGSCFDTIDNDYDGKIDKLDYGCFTR